MSSFTGNAQTTAKRSFENVELRRVATDFDRLGARGSLQHLHAYKVRCARSCTGFRLSSVENVELRRGRVDDGEALL